MKTTQQLIRYGLWTAWLVAGVPALAQEQTQEQVHPQGARLEVGPIQTYIQTDSLYLSFSCSLAPTPVASNEKLLFVPRLQQGDRGVDLPPVAISGKRMRAYDQRAQYVRSDSDPTPPLLTLAAPKEATALSWEYRFALPYAQWMNHATLSIEQKKVDCCNVYSLGHRIISTYLALEEPDRPQSLLAAAGNQRPAEVLADTLAPEEVELCIECTVIYINYPSAQYEVLPQFENNPQALAKVDSVIAHLPAGEFTLQLTGYASPEGKFIENEILARNRTEKFAAYLKQHYTLPQGYRIETLSMGEDWEGTVRMLQSTATPYAAEALEIIHRYGVHDGREKRLMILRQGDVYRDMLQRLFPYLRRIEIRVLPRFSETEKPQEE